MSATLEKATLLLVVVVALRSGDVHGQNPVQKDIVTNSDLNAGVAVSSVSDNSSIVTLSLSAALTSTLSQLAVRSSDGVWIGLGFQNGVQTGSAASMSGPHGTDYLLLHVRVSPQGATVEHRQLQAGDGNTLPRSVANYPIGTALNTNETSWVQSASFQATGSLQLRVSLACTSTPASLHKVNLTEPVRVIFAYGEYGSSGPQVHTYPNRKVVLTQTGMDALCASDPVPTTGSAVTTAVPMTGGSTSGSSSSASNVPGVTPSSFTTTVMPVTTTASVAFCLRPSTWAVLGVFGHLALKIVAMKSW